MFLFRSIASFLEQLVDDIVNGPWCNRPEHIAQLERRKAAIDSIGAGI